MVVGSWVVQLGVKGTGRRQKRQSGAPEKKNAGKKPLSLVVDGAGCRCVSAKGVKISGMLWDEDRRLALLFSLSPVVGGIRIQARISRASGAGE